ncbi:hypothetical protein [Acidithiobacillus thiooxidans]|uniref:hypothetical protein n=1 Tax=Acidithiobacillus thiooxidans TaxID=930 RepID=UPI001C06C79F|nr:hypothetical protein [Acidithiobacillus thiooxidans]MBU2843553.1 hypothetical protein [Acidithiobacillus thiooxidans]
MSFAETLATGKTGESIIARHYLSLGYSVLPIYEKTENEFKGPVLFTPNSEPLIAPDMLVFKGNRVLWIEVKYKSAFTWHRISQKWTTGIDLHHYNQYLKVQQSRPEWEVWILFLHRAGLIAKDTPEGMTPPTGLFGNSIKFLQAHENHRHANHGKSGMVYWGLDALKKSKIFLNDDCKN